MADNAQRRAASRWNRGHPRFQSAIETYAPRLLRLLELRLGSAPDAQDLAQEAYFRLCRVKDPDLVREPESYLFRIACNLANELALRRRSEPRLVDLDTRIAELPESDGNAFVSHLERRSEISRLEAILDELPPLYRAVLVMRKRDGYSHEEIAERLSISPHTVHKYLSRALFSCRAAWAEAHRD